MALPASKQTAFKEKMLATPPHVSKPKSSYYRVEEGRLRVERGGISTFARTAHDAFREKILSPEFSCVAAKAAFNTDVYRFGCYGSLGNPDTTATLARDLTRFCADQDALESDFTTFIAVFRGPEDADEPTFEAALWRQLRALYVRDEEDYSDEVSPDPESPHFGFSFAGRAFFVVGLHPNSTRIARAFDHPALVFNAHQQFEKLRETGRWERLQEVIREREVALQGSLNPNLANFGEVSEARQYSGRAVAEAWRAPFPRRAEELDE